MSKDFPDGRQREPSQAMTGAFAKWEILFTKAISIRSGVQVRIGDEPRISIYLTRCSRRLEEGCYSEPLTVMFKESFPFFILQRLPNEVCVGLACFPGSGSPL